MRFKNNLFYDVEPIKEYSLNIQRDIVIDRLMQQSGVCRDEDSNGLPITFICFKDGTFLLNDTYSRWHRQFFLQGETVCEDGKTKIRIASVKDKTAFGLELFGLIFSALVFIVCAYISFISDRSFSTAMLLRFGLPLLMCVAFGFMAFKEKTAIPLDEKIMLTQIERRINGVIHWDE